MLKEPVANNPENPLISILICDYYGKYLVQCLDSIFEQSVLDNIEVILVDTASCDGAWEIALDYERRYRGLITISRNGRHKDKSALEDCRRLANGKYIVTLHRDQAFMPEYVRDCVAAMEADPFAKFATVKPRELLTPFWPNIKGTPLVNVLIHNYNYGRYLRQCLDSVFAQTYDNIGVVFSDNASTDESWEIANEYAHLYPEKMTLIRNRKNFGPENNLRNCFSLINGTYYCILCSDDALDPNFIKKCVDVLENNPDTAFVMTHRAIIDENGAPSEEVPFYNQSCIIPGPEQAAVYMMAAVNPSISQIMYSSFKSFDHLKINCLVSRWFAQRLIDFSLCCDYSMAYIKEPLLIHRVHSASDSSQISASLMEVFGQFILPHQFADMAARKDNMEKAIGRLPQALAKLSRLCLRYSARALAAHDEASALRYFYLSAAIMPEIYEEPIFRQLQDYWSADNAGKAKILAALAATDNLTARTVSYAPPPGSVALMEGA
jgi:glycosyltransferase involved in cell wall biosynthesis